jgi:uridine kinase
MSDMLRNISALTNRASEMKMGGGAPPPQEQKLPLDADRVTLGQPGDAPAQFPKMTDILSGAKQDLHFTPVPGLPHIVVATVDSLVPLDKEQYGKIEEQMAGYMRAWPSVTSVITLGPTGETDSAALVKSRPDAVEGSALDGVYEVMKRLSSSPSIKDAAKSYPSEFHVVKALNNEGTFHEIHLPGTQTTASLEKALQEGGQPNRLDQVKSLIENLPKGQRVALILAGPSSGGKSTLIKQIGEFAQAEGRKAVPLQGDMYFMDIDDPTYPRNIRGALNWDSPEALDMPRFKGDISSLVGSGAADIPIYNFNDIRPGGWRLPDVKFTGFREDRANHLEVGNDDILIIDSLHAANEQIISQLKELGLPHVTIYLDSERAEDRLVRRVVRDYEVRGGTLPADGIKIWDETAWPGEKEFVRPTILQMDPAQDVFLVTKFAKDPGLSREEIDARTALLDEYGLAPTYDSFGAPAEKLPEMARAEEKNLVEILSSSSTSEAGRKKAQRELNRLRSAPRYNPPLEQAAGDPKNLVNTIVLPPPIKAALHNSLS